MKTNVENLDEMDRIPGKIQLTKSDTSRNWKSKIVLNNLKIKCLNKNFTANKTPSLDCSPANDTKHLSKN